MRVHIYNEELQQPEDCSLIEQTSRSGEHFYGLRIWLKSAQELHSAPEDDDRSAVTFWAPRMDTLRRLVAQLYRTTLGAQ